WPLYAFVSDMVRLSRLQNAGTIVGNSHIADPFQRRIAAATVMYSLEFSLLFVTIFLAYSVCKKIISHNSSLDSVAMRRSA
ncbi:MAG TPA: hypothetical protein VJ654_11845, partial [Noviherbaspirillum sp.]|nr:hypothetical protein [Noviherbaspirillum sp.]